MSSKADRMDGPGSPETALAEPQSDEALTARIEALLPTLRKIARAGFRIPPDEVDDIVQDALVSFFTQASRQPAVGMGLLVVIMRRRCLDFWRRRYRRSRRETQWDELTEAQRNRYAEEGERYCDAVEDGLRLASVWKHLSERCRHALARRFWKHETAAEAAVRVGERPDSYKRMVSRCLGALRQKFESCA